VTSAAELPVLSEANVRYDTVRTFRAMACAVTVRIGAGTDSATAERSIDAVAEVFARVERACTRFDDSSDLMRANAAGDSWYAVGALCFEAIAEAARAHELTDGWFDPRVLADLHRLGYDRTLPFEGHPISLPGPAGAPAAREADPCLADRPSWRPGLDATLAAVRIGPRPVDLGGIGKGLAVRWAVERIAGDVPSFLIEAGGDCYLAGPGPVGAGWQVGVEDPRGSGTPIAVLSISDLACATSSTRIRSWTVGGRPVHHLIDPSTGEPGGAGLTSVTVVDPDPATAEIWSKVLFLRSAADIATVAADRGLAALWVDAAGVLGSSQAVRPHVIWSAA